MADPPASYRVLEKFAALLTARWLREALQALFLIVLARQSTATFGEFVLALETGVLLLLVGEFGFNLALVKRLSNAEHHVPEALLQVSVLKTGLLSLAWLGTLGLVVWQQYPAPLKQVMLLVSAGVGLEALASTFFVVLEVQGRQTLEGKIKAAAAGVGLGYAFLALALGAPPVVMALFKLLENLVNLAGALLTFPDRRGWRWGWPRAAGLNHTFRQSLIFGLLGLVAAFSRKINLFFLQRYGGSEQVAQYAATWPVVDGLSGMVASLLLQAVLYPLFVQLASRDQQELSRLAQNAARWLLAAALALMFGLAVESDRLIPLIFGPRYPDAVWLQKLLVLTIPFGFLQNLAGIVLMTLHLERALLWFHLLGLGLCLLWCLLAVPAWPLLAAALAMLLVRGAVATLSLAAAHRRVPLLPRRALGQLALATAAGLTLYLGASPFMLREPAELLALGPLAATLWRWRREGP